jgi:IS30 family transposase
MGRPRRPRQVERVFWRLVAQGWTTQRAAAAVGVSSDIGKRWFGDGGGMAPMSLTEPSGRFLSMDEREVIDLCWAEGWTQAQIADHLGRHRATISRELRRNRVVGTPALPPLPGGARRRPGPAPGTTGPGRRRRLRYRAAVAQSKADARARRPKPRKLTLLPALQGYVRAYLVAGWSPEQICARLVQDFPDDERMRVSHEAIYQALYVQGRGALRRELTACLRTGRALRKPRRRADARRERIKDMVMISDRPAEVDDRAVPGHWEGDLIIGKDSASAVGTLVERTTRMVMLLHLPADHGAEAVRDAITDKIVTVPQHLRRSLTWDQGIELARHTEITFAADLPVYFCDPHSPWQRGTNENTNGLLRQYLPKGTDLSVHTADDLDAIADRLNGRPRKTLGFKTPAETLARLLSEHQQAGVATTS